MDTVSPTSQNYWRPTWDIYKTRGIIVGTNKQPSWRTPFPPFCCFSSSVSLYLPPWLSPFPLSSLSFCCLPWHLSCHTLDNCTPLQDDCCIGIQVQQYGPQCLQTSPNQKSSWQPCIADEVTFEFPFASQMVYHIFHSGTFCQLPKRIFLEASSKSQISSVFMLMCSRGVLCWQSCMPSSSAVPSGL